MLDVDIYLNVVLIATQIIINLAVLRKLLA